MTSPAATILIVDDEIQNRKLLEALLLPEGYLTRSAASGEEALASIAQDPPDLILMDLQLPGMDGFAATALLKQDPATAAIPVIALTALAMKADREKSQIAGCDAYIAKPLRYKELYAAIDVLLARRAVPGWRSS